MCERSVAESAAQNDHSGGLQAVGLKLRTRFVAVNRSTLFPVAHADGMHARRLAAYDVAGTVTDHPGALHVKTELIARLQQKKWRGFPATTGTGVAGDDTLRMMQAVVECGEFNALLIEQVQQMMMYALKRLQGRLGLGIVWLIGNNKEQKPSLPQGAERRRARCATIQSLRPSGALPKHRSKDSSHCD